MKQLLTILISMALLAMSAVTFAAKQEKVLINHKGRDILVAAPSVEHHLKNHKEDFIVGAEECVPSNSVVLVSGTEGPQPQFAITYVVCDQTALDELDIELSGNPISFHYDVTSTDYDCTQGVDSDPLALEVEFTIVLDCEDLGGNA